MAGEISKYVRWIQAGDRGAPETFNRPTRTLVEYLETINLGSQRFNITADQVHASVADGMPVYLHTDGVYYPCLEGDKDKSTMVGIYKKIDGVDTIYFGGIVYIPGLQQGKKLYLSSTNSGQLEDTGKTLVGTVVSPGTLLIASAGGGRGGAGSIKKEEIYAAEGQTEFAIAHNKEFLVVALDGIILNGNDYQSLDNQIIRLKIPADANSNLLVITALD